MTEKEKFDIEIHCYYEKQNQKIVYVVHDKNGNYATSPISHQEATKYLRMRKQKANNSIN